MKKSANSSISNVGQREKRISARLARKVAAKKPKHLSWGTFIERLVMSKRGEDPHAADLRQWLCGCLVTLDRLARESLAKCPDDLGDALSARLKVAKDVAELTVEIAALRTNLEELLDAC